MATTFNRRSRTEPKNQITLNRPLPWVDSRLYTTLESLVNDLPVLSNPVKNAYWAVNYFSTRYNPVNYYPEYGATTYQNSVLISSQLTLTSNVTIPATATLIFTQGGSIKVLSGYTLTINGTVLAMGNFNPFSGAGTIKFSDTYIVNATPQYWMDVDSIPNLASSATPSIAGHKVWKTNNTTATTITNLTGGYKGQTIYIIFGDGNTTINFTATNMKGYDGTSWTPSIQGSMVCIYDGMNWYCNVSAIGSAGGGAGAPVDATYVTLSANATLTKYRILQGTANQVIVTDSGALNNVTLSLPQSIHGGASPNFTGLTLTSLAMNGVIYTGFGGALLVDATKFFYNSSTSTLTLQNLTVVSAITANSLTVTTTIQGATLVGTNLPSTSVVYTDPGGTLVAQYNSLRFNGSILNIGNTPYYADGVLRCAATGSNALLIVSQEDGISNRYVGVFLYNRDAQGNVIQNWQIGYGQINSNNRLAIYDGTFSKFMMVITPNTGFVGINKTVPTQQLDVNGTIQMTGFKMPTGAGANKALMSDASGVGTWGTAGVRSVTKVVVPSTYTGTDYDYKATGTSDQTTINTAISAVSALGGGEVILMGGVYNTSATINMTSYVMLSGEGTFTQIIPNANNFHVITANILHSIGIRNINIVQNNTPTFSSVFGGYFANLYIHFCDHSFIRDVITQGNGYGLYIYGSSDLKVQACFFYHNRVAIEIYSDTSIANSSTADIFIESNYILGEFGVGDTNITNYNAGIHQDSIDMGDVYIRGNTILRYNSGIYMTSGYIGGKYFDNLHIFNNIIDQCYTRCLYLRGVEFSEITGNHFLPTVILNDSSNPLVTISGLRMSKITDNLFYYATAYQSTGMTLLYISNGLGEVTGLVISNNVFGIYQKILRAGGVGSYFGIALEGVLYSSVFGNTFWSTNQGITMDTNSIGNIVSNNNFYATTAGGYGIYIVAGSNNNNILGNLSQGGTTVLDNGTNNSLANNKQD